MLKTIWAYWLYIVGGTHRHIGNRNNLPSEHEQAVRLFTRSYEFNPKSRKVKLERGIILWRELRRYDEAITDFTELLEEDHRYGPALLNRAMAHQQAGKYTKALADLDAYLRLPRDDEYWDTAIRLQKLLRELVINPTQFP